MADGGGDAEGPGARLGGDGAVRLHQERDRVLLSLGGAERESLQSEGRTEKVRRWGGLPW